MTMEDHRSFLGTGWGFPPTFSRDSHGVLMVADDEDIRSSLEVLLSTRVGERVMQPKYGCDLDRLVFEPIDTGLQAYVVDLITTAILYFEPRIVLDAVVIDGSPLSGEVFITLKYTISATNTRSNHVYPFYRVEGSQVPVTATAAGEADS
jgi:hypothetical protein